VGGKALEYFAWGSCGCPFPGSAQGQVGWSSEKPGLMEGVPGSFQFKAFYDSMIIILKSLKCLIQDWWSLF